MHLSSDSLQPLEPLEPLEPFGPQGPLEPLAPRTIPKLAAWPRCWWMLGTRLAQVSKNLFVLAKSFGASGAPGSTAFSGSSGFAEPRLENLSSGSLQLLTQLAAQPKASEFRSTAAQPRAPEFRSTTAIRTIRAIGIGRKISTTANAHAATHDPPGLDNRAPSPAPSR